MESKKILILSHKPPYPKTDGGCIAIAQLLELLLERNHQVTFLCIETKKHPSTNTIKHPSLRFNSVFVDTKIRVRKAISNLFNKESYILSRFRSTNFKKELTALLKAEKFDTIILESLFTSSYLNSIKQLSQAKIIYRSHNIEYLIWESQRDNTLNFLTKKYLRLQARRLKKEEMKFWNEIECIASISNSDSAHITKYCESQVETVGMYIEDRHDGDVLKHTYVDFFHIGAMDWLPNQEAINWFLNEVWVEFKDQNSNAELHIAGRSMPSNLLNRKEPGYYNHHEVVNALDFISDHTIMLVPLFSGSGLRVKIIEGMAMGKCIISTSLGAEGIPCTHRKNILIADTKKEFISTMQFCYDNIDIVNDIGLEAKKCALEHFSKEKITNKLEELL
jgi:glycosyltransferase involved in cell wall biosynthesis